MKGIVVYTDGSARPNPGFMGSGLHGYLYELNAPRPVKVGNWVHTSQGYLPIKSIEEGGIELVTPIEYLDMCHPFELPGTNNIGELVASYLVFEHFPDQVAQAKEIHIITDSRLVVGGIETILQKGLEAIEAKPEHHQVHWRKLFDYVCKFNLTGKVRFSWVKGHNDEIGNVKSDWHASIATNRSTRGIYDPFLSTTPAKGYHKVDVELHPLLSLKRIYFNSSNAFNKPGIYYQAGYSGNDFIFGKRVGEAAFSVVMLNEPDPYLESIFECQNEVDHEENAIMYVKLDRIRDRSVYDYITTHGTCCLTNDRKNLNLSFLDKKPVTIEVRPGELPLRAIDIMNQLEDLLNRLMLADGPVEAIDPGVTEIHYHDVSSVFYDVVIKQSKDETLCKSVLHKEIGVGVKKINVSIEEPVEDGVKTFDLPLLFSDDIPPRNTLKKLEPLSPKIYLVTWRESSRVLRYATIVKTSDGAGIWSNHFSNLVYF